jgi:hypothetical protein
MKPMMKHARLTLFMLILAALLALVPATLAQDTSGGTNTYGLSAEEYATLNSANHATLAATSAQFDFKIAFAVEGAQNSLQLEGSGLYSKAADNPLFQLAVKGSRVSNTGTTPVDIEVRLTNGILYYRNANANGGQWSGQNFNELIGGIQKSNPTLPVDVSALMKGDFSSLQPLLKGFQAQLPNLSMANYVKMARKDNHFGALLDLGGLLGDQEVRNLLIAIARQGQAQSNGASGQMDEGQMANAAVLVALMLKDSRLTADEWITDNKISRSVVTMTLNVDPTRVGAKGTPTKVSFRFDLDLSGFDGAYVVAVPDGAAMAPVTGG